MSTNQKDSNKMFHKGTEAIHMPSNWHLLLSPQTTSTGKWKNVTYKHKTNGGKNPGATRLSPLKPGNKCLEF